jgi:hypothetical protein
VVNGTDGSRSLHRRKDQGRSVCQQRFDITSTMIGHIFSLHPKHLCRWRLRGARSGSCSIVVPPLSLTAGCAGVPPQASIGSDVLHLLWNTLLENTTLEALDVSNIHDDATFLADNVIPWNRSIIECNIGGNPNLGDRGVHRIVGALVSAASSLERIMTPPRGCSSSPARASSPSVMRKVALETTEIRSGEAGHPSSGFHPTKNGTVIFREAMPVAMRHGTRAAMARHQCSTRQAESPGRQPAPAVSRPSAGFASNTEREVRWGTDASNQPARTVQVPPLG